MISLFEILRCWSLRTAGALIVLAATAFAFFCVLTCREERESLAIGEAYDSIGSDYLPLIAIAIGALLVAVGVMIVWAIARITRRRHDRKA